MPGIFVDLRDADLIQVKLPYYQPYTKRIRKLDGATWGGDDDPVWLLPRESAEDLDDEFFGELIYVTPRHEILEIDPPKPSKIFKKVPRVEIKDLKMKPYDFQSFGANFLAWRIKEDGFAILGDLMGTGKTFQGIMTALQLKQEGLVKKVLVVVLAPTRLQWIKDGIHKFTDEEAYLFSDFRAKYRQKNGKKYVAESINDQKKKAIQEFKDSDTMFMVMSYQGLQQNVDIIEKAQFDMVIYDEAHYMKNKDSKTNKAARKLTEPRTKRHRKGYNKGIKYTLFMSGTPMTNYPDESFGLIRIANEKVFGKWKDFKKKYLVFNEYGDLVGYKNLDKLRRVIQSHMIRRTDAELGLNLPTIIEDNFWFDPHPNQKKLDEALVAWQKELIEEKNNLMRNKKKNEALTIQKKIEGVANLRIMAGNHPNLFMKSKSVMLRKEFGKFAVKDELSIPKFEFALDKIREIVDNGYKVVVFTDSRRMTVMFHKAISQYTRAVRYVGNMSDDVRERRRDKFNNDPSCKVMIANKAGSTGLNLQAGRYLINYDLPATPAEWDQRKYRIRRLDSTHDKVYILNLINREIYDEKRYANILDKSASFNAMIENDVAQSEMHKEMINGNTKSNTKKKRKKKKVSNDNEIWSQ